MRFSVLSAVALGAGLAIGLSVMKKKQQAALAAGDAPTLDTAPSSDIGATESTRAPRTRKTPPPTIETTDFYASPPN